MTREIEELTVIISPDLIRRERGVVVIRSPILWELAQTFKRCVVTTELTKPNG